MISITPEFLQKRPLSYSSLKNFRQSPKHYIQYVTKLRTPPSDAQLIGSAFELSLIEPEKIADQIFVYEKPNLRSNAGKEEWEKIKLEGTGKIMITQDQQAVVTAMVENTRANDEMMQYINSITHYQRKLQWTDKKTGIPFIGYVDAEGDAFGEDWSFEIKTSRNGDPDKFVRDYHQMDYHIQTASYAEGYHKKYYRFPTFAVLVFENVEPYNCSVMMVEGKTLEEYKDEWRASVDAFKFCMDEEYFHQGYEFRLNTMPYFALRKPGYYRPKFGIND